MTSVVYFLRPVGQPGPIKIGCTRFVAARLKTYATWSPVPLEVAATIPGDQKLERQFHTLLAAHHSHHEWFKPHDDVLAVVEQVRCGTLNVSDLPPGRSLSRAIPQRTELARRRQSVLIRLHHRYRKADRTSPEFETLKALYYGPSLYQKSEAEIVAHLDRVEAVIGRKAS
jgi:hypothetical protein